MATVGTPRVLDWLTRNPTLHRTIQQGQMIVCPHQRPDGYPIKQLDHRVNSTHHCPFCPDLLGNPVLIKNERKEYYWPTGS